MYRVVIGPTDLRSVFISRLKKAFLAVRGPEQFRAYLESRQALQIVGYRTHDTCLPLEAFLGGIFSSRMRIYVGCADPRVLVEDRMHVGFSKPTAELEVPSWAERFIARYFEVWGEWHKDGTSAYIDDCCMDAGAALRILQEVT